MATMQRTHRVVKAVQTVASVSALADAARRLGLSEGPALRAARGARAERERLGRPEPAGRDYYDRDGRLVDVDESRPFNQR